MEKGTTLKSQIKILATIALLDALLAVFLLVFSISIDPFRELASGAVPVIAGMAAFGIAAPLSWIAGVYVYRLFKPSGNMRNLVFWALLCFSIAAAQCTLTLGWGIGISAVYGGGLCGVLFILGILDQVFAFIFFSPADNIAELRSMLPPQDDGAAIPN
jgi:hypothetical protein